MTAPLQTEPPSDPPRERVDSPPTAVLEARDLSVTLGRAVDAFRLRVSAFELAPGEHAACIGPSGCGKTTLLRALSGVIQPDSGEVRIDGRSVLAMSESQRRAFRAESIGMVFQHFALIEYLSALDNILLPYRVCPTLTLDRQARARARELARDVGIAGLLRRRPDRLSQGERQRVAICRALVTRPRLLLCDEPTGNLDPARSREAIGLILSEADAAGATALVVTHDHSLLGGFERVIELSKLATGPTPDTAEGMIP